MELQKGTIIKLKITLALPMEYLKNELVIVEAKDNNPYEEYIKTMHYTCYPIEYEQICNCLNPLSITVTDTPKDRTICAFTWAHNQHVVRELEEEDITVLKNVKVKTETRYEIEE